VLYGAYRGAGEPRLKTTAPHLGYGLKRSTLWTGGAEEYLVPKIYLPYLPPFLLCFPSAS
jgi:hypothetical protein